MSDDLISRHALLESVERMGVKGNVLDDDWIYRFIQEFPSEERKRGRWMYIDDDNWLYDTYKCTSCHRHITVDARRVDDIGIIIDDLDFCPYCGADMKGERDATD